MIGLPDGHHSCRPSDQYKYCETLEGHDQVEATTEKRAMVNRRTRLFSRNTGCPEITARPG